MPGPLNEESPESAGPPQREEVFRPAREGYTSIETIIIVLTYGTMIPVTLVACTSHSLLL